MQTGMFMESHLGRLLAGILFLILLVHECLAAPGFPGTKGEEAVDVHPSSAVLANPFGSGEEDRRLLQSFIQLSLTEDQKGGPEISTWEQEVFFLFRLYDYDHNGLLDGLELMKLVSEFNLHHTPGVQAAEQVVSLVDVLLQTQDLNQDGLLGPLELLSPSLPKKQDSISNNAPHQEQEVVVEEKLSNLSPDEEIAAPKEEAERQLQDEDHPQQDVKPEEDELLKQEDEQHGQQIPDVLEGQHHEVPVHQGQPEI